MKLFLVFCFVWPLCLSAATLQWKKSALIEEKIQNAITNVVSQSITRDQIAITFCLLTNESELSFASYRGQVPIYPASVVKLFYLAAAYDWLKEGKLVKTEELTRALQDMIVESSNEATHYILDSLTGTTSGPELSDAELETWYHKRNAVNRYFQSLGYTNINVNRKTWCEGPYGREMQSIRQHKPNHRNLLTTDAAARLMAEIAISKFISADASSGMLKLLERIPGSKIDSQANYVGGGVPEGTKLYSKAGWTSETRHDVAYLELPGGSRVILAIFTVGQSNNKTLIPALSRQLLSGLP